MQQVTSRSRDFRTEEDLLRCWHGLSFKPKVIVFDLDYTLWPFWIDTVSVPIKEVPSQRRIILVFVHVILNRDNKKHVNPPFQLVTESNKLVVVDKTKNLVKHYADVPIILKVLKTQCLQSKSGYLSVASRTTEHDAAVQLIKLFDWHQYFDSSKEEKIIIY